MNACTTPGGTTTVVPAVGPDGLAVDAELELALEHVEAIRVAEVQVGARAVVLVVDEVLEHVGVARLDLDEREPVRLREPVAVAGSAENRPRRRRRSLAPELVVLGSRQTVLLAAGPRRRARAG